VEYCQVHGVKPQAQSARRQGQSATDAAKVEVCVQAVRLDSQWPGVDCINCGITSGHTINVLQTFFCRRHIAKMYKRGATPWVDHVRRYQHEHGISYSEAMSAARASYNPVPYGRIALALRRPHNTPAIPESTEPAVSNVPARQSKTESPRAEEGGKQSGGGLFSDIFARITGGITSRLERRPLNVINVLKQYGNQQITRVRVCKEPINSVLRGILNAASGGDLERTVASHGYDNVFHLFMQLTLADGTVIRIEKNQRVAVALGWNAATRSDTVCEEAKLPQPTTLQEFIDRGEKLGNSHGSFWR